jgi:hypothetical protein
VRRRTNKHTICLRETVTSEHDYVVMDYAGSDLFRLYRLLAEDTAFSGEAEKVGSCIGSSVVGGNAFITGNCCEWSQNISME